MTASAMSSGVPVRCKGVRRMKSVSHSEGSPDMVIVPGAMALTRTSGASSLARHFVSMMMPALDMQCGM